MTARVLVDGEARDVTLPAHLVAHADSARRALDVLYRAALASVVDSDRDPLVHERALLARSAVRRQWAAALASVETTILAVTPRPEVTP